MMSVDASTAIVAVNGGTLSAPSALRGTRVSLRRGVSKTVVVSVAFSLTLTVSLGHHHGRASLAGDDNDAEMGWQWSRQKTKAKNQ